MKDFSLSHFTRAFFLASLVGASLALSGCPPKRNLAPSDSGAQGQVGFVYHRVQYPGETLSIIANWYTGNPRNWELILDANPGLDPRRMRIGDTIHIPREFIVREDPMPRSAVGSRSSAAPKPSSPPQATSSASVSSEAAAPVSERTLEESPEESLGEIEASSASSESASSEEAVFDPGAEVVEEASSSVSSVADEAAPLPSEEAAPSGEERPEQRIKTRDELLKELLEE